MATDAKFSPAPEVTERILRGVPGSNKIYAGSVISLDFNAYNVSKTASFELPEDMSLKAAELYVMQMILEATTPGLFGLEEADLRTLQSEIMKEMGTEA